VIEVYPTKTWIGQQSDSCESFLLILEGEAEICVQDGNSSIVKEVLKEGSFYGEWLLFGCSKHPFHLRAKTRVTLRSIPKGLLLETFQDFPDLVEMFQKSSEKRMAYTESDSWGEIGN
jgi:CRP-like cAMP-binding protein